MSRGLRIVGGVHRGRRLIAPPGEAVRPTSDRAREALFNILSHGRFAASGLPFAGRPVLDAFAGTGIDPYYGRRLPECLRGAGLQEVGNEARAWVMHGGSPGARWFQLSLAHLRPRLVEADLLTDAEVDRMLELFDDPNWAALSPLIVAAWGQRSRG